MIGVTVHAVHAHSILPTYGDGDGFGTRLGMKGFRGFLLAGNEQNTTLSALGQAVVGTVTYPPHQRITLFPVLFFPLSPLPPGTGTHSPTAVHSKFEISHQTGRISAVTGFSCFLSFSLSRWV